jgi:hypothetical protein
VNRNLVLLMLVLCLCGWQVCLGGLLPLSRQAGASGRDMERRLWRQVFAPLLPALVMAALLLGWALQEPSETDEILRPAAFVCGAAIVPLWARALGRALWALRVRTEDLAAATVGLRRPRIVLGERLRRSLDQRAIDALLAHEQAHVAHRDPLRIWLAQLATDLQWPMPAAGRRFRAWLGALELARDEEARAAGAAGEDLAAAILTTARLATNRPLVQASAPLIGADEARNLAERIDRLFAPVRADDPNPARGKLALALGLAVALAFAAGVTHGDAAVRALSIFVSASG